MPNSWLHLQQQDPDFLLDKSLSDSDSFQARDCGWVEQMQPFIREFSTAGAVVLDPFSGFGSTLIAAHLEGRRAVGIEIEENRHKISCARLEKLGIDTATLLKGDCKRLVCNIDPVDLILTNIPYFGCSFKSSDSSQIYSSCHYSEYLYQLRGCLKQFRCALKPSAYIVCMAQNIHIEQQFIPQAWDLAKLMAEQFQFIEERVIVYDKAIVNSNKKPSNRAHEYALIAQNTPKAIDLPLTLTIALEIQQKFPEAIVFGSLAKWLSGEKIQPSDLDIFLPFNPSLIQELLIWLTQRGFTVTRWGAPFSHELFSVAGTQSNYLRAELLDATGKLLLIDIAFSKNPIDYQQLTKHLICIEGIRCSHHDITFTD